MFILIYWVSNIHSKFIIWILLFNMKNIKYIFEGVCNFFFILECVYIKVLNENKLKVVLKIKHKWIEKAKEIV